MKANAEELASVGFNYLGVPYSRMDCQTFAETCLRACGISLNLPGSNAWFREMTWTGTPEECKGKFGRIPDGSFLFILAFDGGEVDRGYHDGLGNAKHMGIVTGQREGAIHSSESRGEVCESKFEGKTIKNGGWNRIGLWDQVDYGTDINRILDGGKEDAQPMIAYVISENGKPVNFRDEPDGQLIERIQIGTQVEILGSQEYKNENWSYIRIRKKTGWMMKKFLEIPEGQDADIGEPAYDGPGEDPGETVLVSREELMKAYNIIGYMLGYRG